MAAGSKSPNDVFIPYQPEGPTAHMMPQRDAIQWLPPNTSTPSPMKRGDLPVFTAKSAIPFGMNPSITVPTSTARESTDVPALEKLKPFDPAVWDVPETPKK
jgi:histone deacetylase HOS3